MNPHAQSTATLPDHDARVRELRREATRRLSRADLVWLISVCALFAVVVNLFTLEAAR